MRVMAIAGIFEQGAKPKRIWPEKPNKYHMLQVLVALGGGLSSLAPGMSMGFSAVALPQLRPPSPRPGGATATLPPTLRQDGDNNGVKANATESLPSLESTEVVGELSLTNEQSAWFMSITMATTPLGCFISGYLNDMIGRKGALLSVAFPGVVGWLMLATVPTVFPPGDPGYVSVAVVSQMILGRALSGIAIGMASSPASVLSCETTSPRFRGAVLCINSLFIALGVLLVYLMGEVASGWRVIAAFGAILTGMVALLSTTLPESPVWLRSRGRHGDADWVCYRLGLRTTTTSGTASEGGAGRRREDRGGTAAGDQECSDRVDGVMDLIRLLLKPETLRPLFTLAGLFVFQQAAGIFVVTFNAVEIAAASGIRGAVVNSHMTAILIGMCTLLGLSLVCIFIDRLGRRPAAIFSASVMSVSMAVLAIYVHTASPNPQLPHPGKHRPFWTRMANCSQPCLFPTTDGNHSFHWPPSSSLGDPQGFFEALPASDSPWHSWIPLAALLTWAFSSALGLLPLPWALPPELLPAKTRSVGFGILSALAYTFAFVALRVFSSLVVPLGLAGCMFIMSISAGGGAVYVAALLPETKGMAIDGLEERGGGWKEIHSSVNTVDSPHAEEEEIFVYA